MSIPISEEERSALREGSDEAVCWIRWTLVIDNAGRVWETRQIKGKRARRLRWWSRQRQEYPFAWLYPEPVTVLARLNPNFRRWLRAHEGNSLLRVTIDQ